MERPIDWYPDCRDCEDSGMVNIQSMKDGTQGVCRCKCKFGTNHEYQRVAQYGPEHQLNGFVIIPKQQYSREECGRIASFCRKPGGPGVLVEWVKNGGNLKNLDDQTVSELERIRKSGGGSHGQSVVDDLLSKL